MFLSILKNEGRATTIFVYTTLGTIGSGTRCSSKEDDRREALNEDSTNLFLE